ncbi:MAG TPA: radical SAM protein [Verrucomicrobiae bacterium]|nr:radical SAM protein [Verrucomicrobiae bacterium]
MNTKKRIGFIAMSGVRAHNEELTRLGLTLPGFVDRNKIIASLPSLGLLTLAGLTPDRFDISYHEIADLKKLLELPTDFDLVAISTFTAQFYEACDAADYFRVNGIPVVMGGITVSSLREQAKAHCTSVVVGEGELLWPEVLADFERGDLKPFYSTKRDFNLADAPMPRFDLLAPQKYNRLTVQTSRGCPHRCEFCASSILLTPRYKVKPVEKVIAEIHEIKKIWPKPFIEFADDNSFVHRGHYRRLLRELAGEELRWFSEADIGVAGDDELLGLMRDSGCQQVLIGLESPRRDNLNGIELRNNWKARQQEHYQAAIAKIQSYGITVNGCFILGLDGDTPGVFDDVLEFVRDSGLYEVQVTFQTAFPGTPLHARLKREGRIIHDNAWELCTLFDINFRPKHMSVAELQSGFLKLAKQLYSAEETQERRAKFKRRLKKSPNFGRRVARQEPVLAAQNKFVEDAVNVLLC